MFFALLGAILLAGCGGNGDTTSQTTFNNGSGDQPFKPTTHLSHRALVTNFYSSNLDVVDTTEFKLTTFTFAIGGQPTYMQPSPDGTLTLVNNTGSNSISSFNNNLEAVKATIGLTGYTESFVTSVNNKVGFAAVPNYSNGSFRVPGAIVRFNPTDGSLNTQIQFPNVLYLGMDPAEKHLVAFTQSDYVPYWVDLSTLDPNTQVPPYYKIALSDSSGNPVLLSRPVSVFFSANTAYVLSCGPECGGSDPASVTAIDLTTIAAPATPTTGATITAKVLNVWQVSGARQGLLDTKANKLYVAGSTTTSTAIDCPFADINNPTLCAANSGGNNVQDGYFTVIDLTAGTASAPIRIGNGAKHMIRSIKGVFWVGSTNCGVESCISMVNPSGTTPASVLSIAKGDATGITLATNNDFVYTIEGGELFIYDKNNNPFVSQYNTDVKGQASDILYID
jgi:hypothetical protein